MSSNLQQPGKIVELVGPAGSGKTTLFKALEIRDPCIIGENAPPIWGRSLWFYFKNFWRLIPILLHLPDKGSKNLSRYDFALMILLTGWPDLLKKKATLTKNVLLLDQGPIFMMAYLSIFRFVQPQNASIEEWWRRINYQWAKTLDTVVYLETSIETLISRNRLRQDHEIEHINGKTDLEAREFLEKYQSMYKGIIQRLSKENDQLQVIWIDSEVDSIEKTVETVMNKIESK